MPFRLRSYVPRDVELAAMVDLAPQPSAEATVKAVERRLNEALQSNREDEVIYWITSLVAS